jgi:hypothetical protein
MKGFVDFRRSYRIVVDFQSCDLETTILQMVRLTNVKSEIYIFILIRCHCDELCFGKDEGIHMIRAIVIAMQGLCRSDDMQSRNIFLHGIQHDLNRTLPLSSLRQRVED